jgi:hypothetical protein
MIWCFYGILKVLCNVVRKLNRFLLATIDITSCETFLIIETLLFIWALLLWLIAFIFMKYILFRCLSKDSCFKLILILIIEVIFSILMIIFGHFCGLTEVVLNREIHLSCLVLIFLVPLLIHQLTVNSIEIAKKSKVYKKLFNPHEICMERRELRCRLRILI